MKILVADKFEESGCRGLAELKCEVLYQPDLKGDSLTEAIRNSRAEVLVVRSTQVTGPMLDQGDLRLVVRAGTGYNTIDVKAASSKGIQVANCPGRNSIAVAELAFGLILDLDRRISDNVRQLREGRWNKKEFSNARGLFGRTLGIVGLGYIGQQMIPRAKAFGMDVIGCDIWLTPAGAHGMGISYAGSPEETAADCDILTIHLALNTETRGIIGAAVFQAMRPNSYFINTSRGELVDYNALQEAIQNKGIRAGLDVYAKEPEGSAGLFEDPIVKLSNVYGTHHIGASTEQAQESIAAETVRIIRVFKESGQAPNVINPCSKEKKAIS